MTTSLTEHVHDTSQTTTVQQTVHGVVYDVTTERCSCGKVGKGTATPR